MSPLGLGTQSWASLSRSNCKSSILWFIGALFKCSYTSICNPRSFMGWFSLSLKYWASFVFSSYLCSRFTAILVMMLSWSSKRSTSTNAKVDVITLGGTLGEVEVNVPISRKLPKLVDRCLALIPSMVSSDFSKESHLRPLQ